MSGNLRRVLVVSDEEDTKNLVSSIVSDAGCTKIEADTPVEACRILSREPIELVILDHDILRKHPPKSTGENWRLLLFPTLILVADRKTWNASEHANIWETREILWKPLDPHVLFAKIRRRLEPESPG